MAGIQLEQQQPSGRLLCRWVSAGLTMSLPWQSGSSSLSEQLATWSCWWCWCGDEVVRRSALSCSLGLWPSPTLVWCSVPSGSRLTKNRKKLGCSGSFPASYYTCGNGWRWIVPYGHWARCQLTGKLFQWKVLNFWVSHLTFLFIVFICQPTLEVYLTLSTRSNDGSQVSKTGYGT